ncbi:glutamyl-tRNA(Gln) amidotransferase subunit A [Planctomycetota bacterium]|nr:glutamyl-tRNA(Gln) amidotransferase subunit A [Planctomycetota bacterium]
MTESITAIAAAVNGGRSARNAVEHSLHAAERDTLNAIIRVHRPRAVAAADVVDARVRSGERLPLAGVPLVIKDNLCLTGAEVGCCSKILAGFIAPYTATAVARLEAAGAVVVATANMDEFAMGSSNETSCRGPVRHPLDPARVPGGSSGGCAAAVAAGIAPLALGSDTGGSIRQPASLCGVVGAKPSYGAVSRYGLIAFGSSLDQIGPFAADVAGAETAFRAMAGHDPLDSTSAAHSWAPVDQTIDPRAALRGLRVGWCPAHVAGLAPGVRARLDAAKSALESAGARLVEVELPHERFAVAVYYVIATGEAASNLARFDGIRFGHRASDPKDLGDLYARSRAEGFGAEVRRRIFLGTYVLSTGYYDAYYKKAQQVRALIVRDYQQAFASCDVLLGPASPTTAFRRGEKTADPLQMYLSDVFTIATNLAGVPGVSVPFGADERGLPVGMQLQAALGDDARMWQVAAGLEALAR